MSSVAINIGVSISLQNTHIIKIWINREYGINMLEYQTTFKENEIL